MQIYEAQQLNHGLYNLHWKSGESSLAAIGSWASGRRWFAPVNWINFVTENNAVNDWARVDRVELIEETTGLGNRLTKDELRVYNNLGRAWNEYTKLEKQTNNERNEFMQAIHAAQSIILARLTLREQAEIGDEVESSVCAKIKEALEEAKRRTHIQGQQVLPSAIDELINDKFAIPALEAYAKACEKEDPHLAKTLRVWIASQE